MSERDKDRSGDKSRENGNGGTREHRPPPPREDDGRKIEKGQGSGSRPKR